MSLSQSLYVNFLSSFEAIIFKPLTRYLHRRYLKSKGGQPIWWKTFAWIWSFSCFNTVQFQSHLNADGLLWSSLCCNLSRRVKCYWTGWKHSPTKPCPLYRKPRIRWSQHETDSCKIVSGCEPKRKKAFKKKIINVYKSRGKNYNICSRMHKVCRSQRYKVALRRKWSNRIFPAGACSLLYALLLVSRVLFYARFIIINYSGFIFL